MVSLIGGHYSRNGIKQFPARVTLSMYSNGLGGDETHPDTVTILRDTRIFPSGEAPPDFHTFDPVASGITWEEYGRYWYSERTEVTTPTTGGPGFRNFKEAWDTGQPAHYYTICNEQGGGEGNTPEQKEEIRRNVQRLCDIERAIAYAANADGRKCCVGNFAGGSPGDIQVWKEIVAPFLVEMWQNGGNIYGRHVYAEQFIDAQGNVAPGQPQRVIDELKHLKSIGYGGGVVLTECGLDGGYGVADLNRFTYQVQAWEAALRPYSDILIGFCWWEIGDTDFHADYTEHLKTLIPFMNNSYLGKWEPAETQQPPDGGEGEPVTVKRGAHVPFLGGVTNKKLILQERRWNAETQGYDLIRQHPPIKLLDETTILYAHVENDEPTDPNPPPVVSNPLPQGALVVDVSYANDVNFATLKANGVQGVIIRASNGIRLTGSSNAVGVDVRFWQHLEEAAALGMPWGAYHYCNENYDDVAQVQHFLSIIETAVNEGYPLPSLGLWLDFETPSDPAYAGAPTTEARIQALCTILASLRPSTVADYGVYTSKGWWDSKVPNAASWVPSLGLKAWAAAWPDTNVMVNGWPPSWWHPSNLKGFTAVHFWQWTSIGGFEVGHSVDSLDLNFVGNTAVAPVKPPTPPPTGSPINMTQYYLPPSGRTYGDISIKSTNWGQGDLRQQLQLHGGYCYVTKGGEIEKRMILDDHIYFLLDDSPGDGKYYTVNSPTGWIPKKWAVGQAFTRQETTTFYYKATCQPTGEVSNWANQMLFKALYAEWTSPHGIKLQNVAHLQWLVNGVVEEDYYLAPGLGYAGWKNRHGRESWIKELVPYTDQQPNKFAGGCYHEPIG